MVLGGVRAFDKVAFAVNLDPTVSDFVHVQVQLGKCRLLLHLHNSTPSLFEGFDFSCFALILFLVRKLYFVVSH